MPSFLRLLRTRRLPNRLRSFHLSPPLAERTCSPRLDNTRTGKVSIPIRGSTLVILAAIASLFFVISISCAFLGAEVEDVNFKITLDEVAIASPGIVLIGESVDVDVDEPSITIRWSILACGPGYVLPESSGIHGSDSCGLPPFPILIFVDNSDKPTATYDPATIPINKETGHRRNIQNLVQFDSDHVLDVHDARLYPFDTYFLTSTFRAITFPNGSLPIQKLITVDVISSFNIWTIDMESFSKTNDGTVLLSRDMDMHVWRPGSARLFALFLFTISWFLTHVTIGHVLLARRTSGRKSLLKHLASAGAILISIPQLRNSMPDTPGLDGVLIDEIGYFPQMIISSIATAILLLIFAVREFDIVGFQAEAQQKQDTRLSTTYTCPLLRDRSHPGHMFTGFGRGNSYPFRTSSDWCLPPPRTPNPWINSYRSRGLGET